MKVGRLLLRITVGGFFVGHGTQKLFGWFGGQGLAASADGFDSMGLKPGKLQAGAAGVAEAAGGAALAAGYQTPLASAAIISVMLTAINRVHLKNGPWATKGGYEYNAVLIAAAASLAESGPGALSLDALRGKQKEGAKWSIFALGLGAAGAAGAHYLTEARASKDVAPLEATSNGVVSDPVVEVVIEAEVAEVPEPDAGSGKVNGKKAGKAAAAAEEAELQATEPEPEAGGDAEAEAETES
jgi:putative oxidoreductase